MRYLLPIVICCLTIALHAQNAENLVASMQSVNQSVVRKSCGTDSAAAISHRAMSVFLADKTGYLSANTDLSFYTNYVTFSTAEGKLTVNHNFQKAKGSDEPVKLLFSTGFDMTTAGEYAKSFLDNRYENELGFSPGCKWLGKVKTRFADCTANGGGSVQKQAMDALRAALLLSLTTAIMQEETAFNASLVKLDATAVPNQNTDSAKALMRRTFYAGLKADYEEKFATQQAVLLSSTKNFRSISTHWTSVEAYIPVFYPKYVVAASLNAGFRTRHPFAFMGTLGHTRMWESSTKGRLFVTLNASLLFNNSKLTYGLNKLSYPEYKSLGGTDTLPAASAGDNQLYTGQYKTFITPSLTARVVYFFNGSHVGVSVLAEQNFGDYHSLNLKAGIPIVIINSKKTPAVNIECYVLFFDLAKSITQATRSRHSLGLSVGIPFSRLMY